MSTVNSVARKEPAVGIGASISAILYGVYAILRASGIEVTEDMVSGVNALMLALCAVPAVSGFLTRFFVSSPDTVGRIVHGEQPARTPPTNTRPETPGLARSSR